MCNITHDNIDVIRCFFSASNISIPYSLEKALQKIKKDNSSENRKLLRFELCKAISNKEELLSDPIFINIKKIIKNFAFKEQFEKDLIKDLSR